MTKAAACRMNLLALRSVTKIYAMPGIRIGYAVTSSDMVSRLRRYQNPWSVDSPSEAALLAALDDDEYLPRSIALIEEESAWLTERLWDIKGIRPAWPARRRPVAVKSDSGLPRSRLRESSVKKRQTPVAVNRS